MELLDEKLLRNKRRKRREKTVNKSKRVRKEGELPDETQRIQHAVHPKTMEENHLIGNINEIRVLNFDLSPVAPRKRSEKANEIDTQAVRGERNNQELDFTFSEKLELDQDFDEAPERDSLEETSVPGINIPCKRIRKSKDMQQNCHVKSEHTAQVTPKREGRSSSITIQSLSKRPGYQKVRIKRSSFHDAFLNMLN